MTIGVVFPMPTTMFDAALALWSSCSVEQVLGDIAAVVSDAGKHGLVQPNIHLSRIPHQIRGAAQLNGQLFARCETAVYVEQL